MVIDSFFCLPSFVPSVDEFVESRRYIKYYFPSRPVQLTEAVKTQIESWMKPPILTLIIIAAKYSEGITIVIYNIHR
jgi:hypothetical protein